MKASDYIAEFIAKQGVKHAFVFQGGCIVHSINSIGKREDINYVSVQHEQAGAMAADAYSRITGNLGVALATSGPGATNLLTGVCCSYYDSIPTLMITGQVPSGQLKKESQSRQIGFQETDVVGIFKPATKYSALVDNPTNLRYELEKATFLARNGRPGPVLLDICDDVQRANIEPNSMQSYIPERIGKNLSDLESKMDRVYELISHAQRPVVILGGGIRLAGAIESAKGLVKTLNFPVVPTWAGMDYLPYSNPLVVGSFGVSSERAGNFAVQNSDLIIAIGTRLDTHETGPRQSTFGRGAKKVVVDIDQSELDKYEKTGLKVDLPICADVNDFLRLFNSNASQIKTQDISDWNQRIREWKTKYPICQPAHRNLEGHVSPYLFMEELSKNTSDDEVVITDAGANLTWTMQAYRVKRNQRLISAFNHSPMGYSLPASIGAAFATDKPISCIIGDGGMQINVQDLATIAHYNLPIKIFLMNNHGHGIIKQTLDTWLNSRYDSVDSKTGLPDPNLAAVARAYGIQTREIKDNSELKRLDKIGKLRGPVLIDVSVHPNQPIEPKLVFGKPIEDSAPLLPREEFRDNMIVKPIE